MSRKTRRGPAVGGHQALIRRMPGVDVWSTGCTCGWRCDHPVRGDRRRAEAEFITVHAAELPDESQEQA